MKSTALSKLLEDVWPDVFVEGANLTVNIASLRREIADSDAERQWIETVPKRGYRFVAEVSEFTEILNSVAVLPGRKNSSIRRSAHCQNGVGRRNERLATLGRAIPNKEL